MVTCFKFKVVINYLCAQWLSWQSPKAISESWEGHTADAKCNIHHRVDTANTFIFLCIPIVCAYFNGICLSCCKNYSLICKIFTACTSNKRKWIIILRDGIQCNILKRFSGILQQCMLKLFVTMNYFICGSLNVHLIISGLPFVDLDSLKLLLGRLMEIHCKFIVLH